MIGIVVGFIYFILVCLLNRLFFSKSQHPKIWIIICMFFSLILGCIFSWFYSEQNKDELIGCIYIIIPLTLLDILFDRKHESLEKKQLEDKTVQGEEQNRKTGDGSVS